MRNYTKYVPDKWVVIKINDASMIQYRVFATWHGGYSGADTWQINSGIKRVKDTTLSYEFTGESGSTYICSKNAYGTSIFGHGVLASIISENAQHGAVIEVLSGDTNFLRILYDRKSHNK